jgi:hypothetical protein
MARFYRLAGILLLSVLSGCNAKSVMDHVAPETVQELKTNFDHLRHGQYDQVESALDPGIERSSARTNLTKMAALIPAQEPVSVKTVGAFARCDTRTGCDTRVTVEYEFPTKWVITQMVVHSKDGKSTVTSFRVQQESESLEAANRFTLRGRRPVQYLILGAGIVSIAVMIYALVLCIRTPMRKRKWLWIIVTLLGVGKLGVDWTTGQISYHILWIAILPAGMGSQLYGAWIVTVSLPLGALLFLVRRERLRKADTPEQGTDVHPPEVPVAENAPGRFFAQ